MNPAPNAYTHGDRTPFVTVTSGLVEGLEPEELRAVIAHECGHVALQHTLYHTMAALLAIAGTQILGPLAPVSTPVVLALRYWLRRSELSADRAAAAVMGSAGPVVETLIRLAGGPKSITRQIDIGLYAEQAIEYDRLSESKWDQLLQGLVTSNQTHPFLAVRTREIVLWGESEQFQHIAARVAGDNRSHAGHAGDGEYTRKAGGAGDPTGAVSATAGMGERCPICGRAVHAQWKFCRACGAALERG
jgi:hypothetical protein